MTNNDPIFRELDLLSDKLIALALTAGMQARIRFVKCPAGALKRTAKRASKKAVKR